MKARLLKDYSAWRWRYLSIILLLTGSKALCQNIGINASGATPAASAMLDIASTNSGLLVPRVALTAANVASPVTSPATSLLVYNTAIAGTSPNDVLPGYYYWNGAAWIEFLDVTGNVRFSGALMPNNLSGSSGNILQSNGTGAAPTWITLGSLSSTANWALDGNAVAANRNFGTTTSFSLPFITNNVARMRISNLGNVAIGTSTFNGTFPEMFLVDAGTTTSVNGIVGKGSINNYLQLNIQNTSAGTNAFSDVVATADNGSETTNYVDMGINSSLNSSAVMGAANDAYLYKNILKHLLNRPKGIRRYFTS
jgi:hypothetical protein